MGTFDEDVFESVFVEIERSGGLRNDIVGAVYRPPRGDLRGFTAEMAQVLQQLHGTDMYIMGDFNVDLLKLDAHSDRPRSDFLGELTSGGFYPLISLPTRLTDTTATLTDSIWTNKVEEKTKSGLVTVRVADHLPIFAFVGGVGAVVGSRGKER